MCSISLDSVLIIAVYFLEILHGCHKISVELMLQYILKRSVRLDVI